MAIKTTLIALLALCLCLPLAGAEKKKTDVERRGYKFEFTGKVVSVHDGDTITVLLGKGGQQPYSRQATQFTEKLVGGKMVKVKTIGKSRNRVVGIVTLPDGRRLGRELLAAGYGWLDPRFSKDAALLKAQEAAKKAVSLRGWSLRDKAKNVYGLSGSIAANGRRVITMKSNSMPLNNDGDTIMLVQGNTSRHTVSYSKKQAGNGAVVKAGK